MMSMSGGGFSYNRFDAYEKKLAEAAKPDYLDFDGDGNKKEPMKKALKEKGKKPVAEETIEEKKDLPDFIQKKVDEKKGKKDDDCECDHKDDKKEDKKEKKESVTKDDVLGYLLENNYANNPVSAEILFNHMSDSYLESIEADIMEVYKGKHGMSDKEYMDGRSDAGKQISGDSKSSGANYSYRAKNTGPNKPGVRPQGQARMSTKDRTDLAFRKAALKNKG